MGMALEDPEPHAERDGKIVRICVLKYEQYAESQNEILHITQK